MFPELQSSGLGLSHLSPWGGWEPTLLIPAPRQHASLQGSARGRLSYVTEFLPYFVSKLGKPLTHLKITKNAPSRVLNRKGSMTDLTNLIEPCYTSTHSLSY